MFFWDGYWGVANLEKFLGRAAVSSAHQTQISRLVHGFVEKKFNHFLFGIYKDIN